MSKSYWLTTYDLTTLKPLITFRSDSPIEIPGKSSKIGTVYTHGTINEHREEVHKAGLMK